MIIIFTGNGKGKTSAALGTAFRSIGWENKVAIIQFIKGNKEIGEWKTASKLKNIEIFQFVDDKKLVIGKPTEDHLHSMPSALAKTMEIITSHKFQLIILDEINNAISHKLVKVSEIIKILLDNPDADYILTGRSADPRLVEIADTVTEMKKVKHPFDKGVLAKRGIDY